MPKLKFTIEFTYDDYDESDEQAGTIEDALIDLCSAFTQDNPSLIDYNVIAE